MHVDGYFFHSNLLMTSSMLGGRTLPSHLKPAQMRALGKVSCRTQFSLFAMKLMTATFSSRVYDRRERPDIDSGFLYVGLGLRGRPGFLRSGCTWSAMFHYSIIDIWEL